MSLFKRTPKATQSDLETLKTELAELRSELTKRTNALSLVTAATNGLDQKIAIIDERLKHSEKTLAQLYDPNKMPKGLREAHHQNDLAVERCYRSTPFNSDEERLEYLFKLYEKMIQEEKDKDTLFAKQKKTRKRK